ncbi:MAG TPA: DinB family protein, partial [Pirellulales bacterium]
PGWAGPTLTTTEWDYHPPGGEQYQTPNHVKRDDVLKEFDKNVAEAVKQIAATSDDEFGKTWALKYQGNTMFTMPRTAVIRSFVLNHLIHHRAILCVYLRLNDVPVPGMYGPSGDE